MLTVAVYRARGVLVRVFALAAMIYVLSSVPIAGRVAVVSNSGVSQSMTFNEPRTLRSMRDRHGVEFTPSGNAMHVWAEQFVNDLAIRSVEGGALIGILTASALGGNLGRERSYLALAWTRPQSRRRQALTTIGVDLAAIGAAMLAISGLNLAWSLVGMHNASDFAPSLASLPRLFASTLVSAAGAAVMWYGMVACATAAFAKSAASWFAWPVAIGMFIMEPFAEAAHFNVAASALGALNPYSYIPRVPTDVINVSHAVPALSWTLGIVGTIAAAALWCRRDYSR